MDRRVGLLFALKLADKFLVVFSMLPFARDPEEVNGSDVERGKIVRAQIEAIQSAG